ncbi:MAG: sensor histidine kinase, partial [Xanthobacteraceae bacterium]
QRAAERELLFKEANHRLKNSLQIVSSMLHMQLPLVNDNVAAEALRNAEARVMAIATVHERLYKDRHIGSITFDRFLRDLCGNIARAYGSSDAIQVNAQPIVVDRDQAISVALIVNELVTNVFRHAELPCRVRLWDEGNHSFRLRVSDTGKGPATGATSGLGTRMITALVTQLNGSLETKADDEGYHCEIFVPHLR